MSWILVLGASSDIAQAVAEKFAEKNFNVYLAGRNLKELEQDATNLNIRYNVQAKAIFFDALDFESHLPFYENLDEKPCVALLAIGYLGNQELGEKDFSEARKILDTNYTGCVSILNTIAEKFVEQKRGSIIAISSVAGDRGRQSNYLYGSAKAGLSAYLSGLRNRLCKQGVHVLTVKPGFVKTQMTADMDLPKKLTASPEQVAGDIFKAWQKNKSVLYTRWFWRYIMTIICSIPEFIFKKLSL